MYKYYNKTQFHNLSYSISVNVHIVYNHFFPCTHIISIEMHSMQFLHKICACGSNNYDGAKFTVRFCVF